jgi:hypothetical protein
VAAKTRDHVGNALIVSGNNDFAGGALLRAFVHVLNHRFAADITQGLCR